MRFIAPGPYSICLRDPVEEVDPLQSRRHNVTQKGVYAHFRTGDYTEYEKSLAIQRFRFNGLPVDEHTQFPIDPGYRIGTFDTELQDWDEETRDFAEQALVSSPFHGADFILVERPPAPAPWQGYDNTKIEKILEMVKLTESDPVVVINYERENKNRKTLIAALRELVDKVEDEVVVEA